ncbi:MAG: diguanylate cyclase [Thermoclostridium sp.]|nr:diguanylate cyclase [Thermoclostridium sp.]
MKREEDNEILEIGVLAAELLAFSGYSGIIYGDLCLYLFQQLGNHLERLRLYIFDEAKKVFKEEAICTSTGIIQGQDLVPLYQLPDEVQKEGKATQLYHENKYSLIIPLTAGKQFFGLLLLDYSKPWNYNVQYLEMMGKSVAIGLRQMLKTHSDNGLLSFFNETVDIANSFHVSNTIEQLVKTFARQAVTHLNFDRVTVFINSYTTHHRDFIFCVTSWGKEKVIEKIDKLPGDITKPLSILGNTGYWFPLFANKKAIGLILFDNFYSHYQIPENFLHMLMPLCSQFSATINNLHLIQDIQRASQRDKLTDLYNRAYFETKLVQMDTEENYPLSYIMGDVNGLKITNDIFGHFEGDVILKEIANLLKSVCRKDDLIARWGGDEFVLLLPKTNEKRAETLIREVKKKCREALGTKIQLSISMGCATKKNNSGDMQVIMKKAEERMYRNKLLERTYFRNTFIAMMRELLHKNCQEPQDHIDRLDSISAVLGKAMNLSENELDELRLLAMLHDIGKVAIRCEVLNKPKKLSKDEWSEVRKHSEAGYRIAQASPEFTRIAGFILSHHERWDGKGYPMGKKGSEIPLLSRIIAVIDAYDVMTHARVYKKAMSHQEAIEELKNGAGTQFDPEIVDKFLELEKTTSLLQKSVQ